MSRFRRWLSLNEGLNLDLLLTAGLAIFWLLFSWQYGFRNSPDCWYRGVLAKSLLEGRPYFVNLKQGFLYEYGPWHHDAAHSPLLPVLYAIFFLFFGQRISIANIIVALSVGLLYFPLARLSRRLFATPVPGWLLYGLVVFNSRHDFLFETFAGLSIPTTVMLLAFFLLAQQRLLETGRKRWLAGAVLSLVAFYYVRPGEQVVFFFLLFWCLASGYLLLARSEFGRLARLWALSAALVLPWVGRKIVLFHHPFFSHTTPALWTDRGYDYWSFHEKTPYPTLSTYLASHSLNDLLIKLFIHGPGNYYTVLDRTLGGYAWLYLALFMPALGLVFYHFRARQQRFLFLTLAGAFLAYSIIYSLVPVLDPRYMSPVHFILFFVLIAAGFALLRQRGLLADPGSRGARALLAGLAVVVLVWGGLVLAPKVIFSFSNSDRELRADLLVKGLAGRISREAVVLGPFAEVQRLNFATGLTLIEEPDNLRQLEDPAAFFRKYRIRYSLVDVSRLLPPEMIEEVEMVGDRPLFTIDLDGAGRRTGRSLFNRQPAAGDAAIRSSIAAGRAGRAVYIDGHRAAPPFDLARFARLGVRPYLAGGDLVEEQARLFRSGLLLLNYGGGQRELSDLEYAVIERYLLNGGRVMLLCPAWVWVSYQRKGLETLPHYRVARYFDLLLTAAYVPRPFKLADPAFRAAGAAAAVSGEFSAIIYDRASPILVGADGRAAAVAARAGNSRLIAWGHNGLFGEALEDPAQRELARRLLDWLFK